MWGNNHDPNSQWLQNQSYLKTNFSSPNLVLRQRSPPPLQNFRATCHKIKANVVTLCGRLKSGGSDPPIEVWGPTIFRDILFSWNFPKKKPGWHMLPSCQGLSKRKTSWVVDNFPLLTSNGDDWRIDALPWRSPISEHIEHPKPIHDSSQNHGSRTCFFLEETS